MIYIQFFFLIVCLSVTVSLHQWGYTNNPLCVCGATQTMLHIVDSCSVYKFEGGLASLHTASDSTVEWLRHSCIR